MRLARQRLLRHPKHPLAMNHPINNGQRLVIAHLAKMLNQQAVKPLDLLIHRITKVRVDKLDRLSFQPHATPPTRSSTTSSTTPSSSSSSSIRNTSRQTRRQILVVGIVQPPTLQIVVFTKLKVVILLGQIFNRCLVKVPRRFREFNPVLRHRRQPRPQHAAIVKPRPIHMFLGNVLRRHAQHLRPINVFYHIRHNNVTVEKQGVGFGLQRRKNDPGLAHLEIRPHPQLRHLVAVHARIRIQCHNPNQLQARIRGQFVPNGIFRRRVAHHKHFGPRMMHRQRQQQPHQFMGTRGRTNGRKARRFHPNPIQSTTTRSVFIYVISFFFGTGEQIMSILLGFIKPPVR